MIRQTVFGFKLESTKEELTAHGGLALMAEYNHGLGLRSLVDRYLPWPGSNRGYDPSVFVDALVLMLQGGGRHLEDLRELERERGLMRLIGREQIPDPDSTGDWLRRMGDSDLGQAGLIGPGQVRDLLNERILRRDAVVEYTLDADAMQVGAEKWEAQFTYQGVKGYMPMVGFLFETPVCLLDEFREGNVAPAKGQLHFYRQCKEQMPCGQTHANAVFFRIGVIAYNLFIGFKRLSCPESWVHHTIATFRWRLIQVAGRIVRHAGRAILRLAVDEDLLSVFKSIRRKCFDLRVVT